MIIHGLLQSLRDSSVSEYFQCVKCYLASVWNAFYEHYEQKLDLSVICRYLHVTL